MHEDARTSPIGINTFDRFVLLLLNALPPPASEVLRSTEESLVLIGVFGLEFGVAISERSSIFLFGGPDGECTGFKVGTGTEFKQNRTRSWLFPAERTEYKT